MAHPSGFEPPTSRLTVERSNQTELWVNVKSLKTFFKSVSHAGTRTRVARVKGGYPNHLDYVGLESLETLLGL